MPHLKGLVKPVTPGVYPQNDPLLGAFSLGPQEGRICVATSDSVPLLGTPEKARVMQPLPIYSIHMLYFTLLLLSPPLQGAKTF